MWAEKRENINENADGFGEKRLNAEPQHHNIQNITWEAERDPIRTFSEQFKRNNKCRYAPQTFQRARWNKCMIHANFWYAQ